MPISIKCMNEYAHNASAILLQYNINVVIKKIMSFKRACNNCVYA